MVGWVVRGEIVVEAWEAFSAFDNSPAREHENRPGSSSLDSGDPSHNNRGSLVHILKIPISRGKSRVTASGSFVSLGEITARRGKNIIL